MQIIHSSQAKTHSGTSYGWAFEKTESGYSLTVSIGHWTLGREYEMELSDADCRLVAANMSDGLIRIVESATK